MAKRTEHNEVFDPNLGKPVIDAFTEINKLGNEAKDIFKSLLVITKDGVIGNMAEDLAQMKALVAGYHTTKTAAEELANVNLTLAKTEQEQLKTKILLTKEQERQAKNSQKAADNAKKEAGAYAQMSKNLNDLRTQYKNLAAQNQHNTKEGRDLLKNVTDLDKKLKDIDATVGQHQRNVGNYRSALEGLPGPLGNAANAAGGLQKQLLALLANPIVLLIAAIVMGLKLLFDAFTKTDEGGEAFAAIMKQVSAVIDVAMQRIGMLADGLVKLFKGEYAAAANQFKAAVTGVKEQMQEAAAAAREYEQAMNDLEDAENAYITTAARAANEIARAEFDAANKNNPIEFRRERLKEALRLREEEAAQEKKFAEIRYHAEVKNMAALKGVNKELLQALVEANYENGKFLLDMNADLFKARNNMTDDEFKHLKELLAKTIDADTQYFEGSKRSISRLSEFEKEIREKDLKAQEDYFKEVWDQLNKDEENRIDRLERLNKASDDFMQEEFRRMEELAAEEERRRQEKKTKEQEAWDLKQQQAFEMAEMEKRVSEGQKTDAEIMLERIKKIAAQIEKIIDGELRRSKEKSDERLAQIDKETKASQDNFEHYQRLAELGNKTAEQSLQAEKKIQAQKAQEREKELKRAQRVEAYLTGLKIVAAKIQAGEKNAVASTLTDLAVLFAGVSGLPAFYEGTEDTGPGGNLDGKGGFLAIQHPHEKVFKREHAEMIGYDTPNSEVAKVMDMYHRGMFVDTGYTSAAIGGGETVQVLNKIASGIDAIKEKDQFFQYDEITKCLVETRKSANKVERFHHRQGGVW